MLRAEKNKLERELTAKEKEAEALAALLSSSQAMSDYKFYNETAKKLKRFRRSATLFGKVDALRGRLTAFLLTKIKTEFKIELWKG